MRRLAEPSHRDRPARSTRLCAIAAAVSTWLLIAAGAAMAAPGDLDPTFGDGGWAFTEISGYGETNDAIIQPDGRIVVVATSGTSMSAWRLLADGGPDPSFGVDGTATVTFERDSAALAIAIQADDKILLAGYAGARIAVVRLLSNGDPDTSFGDGDGAVTVRLAEKAQAEDLEVQPDGKVLVGAALVRRRYPIGAAFVRLTPEGGLDDGFGTNGVALHEGHVFRDLTVDGQGSVIVTLSPISWRSTRFFVARYTSDGVADPTFGGKGVHRYVVRGVDDPGEVLVDGEGKILFVMSGASRRCPLGTGAVVRLTPEGDFDPSFSDDGVALRRCILQRRIVDQADGNILVGGSMLAGGGSGEYKPTLAKLTPTGEADVTFGEDGMVLASPGDSYWSGTRGLFLQDNKIILVAGGIYEDGFAAGRFLAG
jgi:uncharacterized delta-60 repeat protein